MKGLHDGAQGPERVLAARVRPRPGEQGGDAGGWAAPAEHSLSSHPRRDLGVWGHKSVTTHSGVAAQRELG